MRKLKGDDRLEIRIAEVISDFEHAMDTRPTRLEKDGVEAHLQEALAAAPGWCGEGFRLVRREWPTDIGPVDLMCRDEEDGWIAVEIKRIGTIDAVEQLTRYLERIRLDPALASAAACSPRRSSSRRRACSRRRAGITWVEVDLAVLRGEREPALTLFGSRGINRASRASAGAMVSDLPRSAGRYEIHRLLGRGGMASVHLARQPALDREVALKELHSVHRRRRRSRIASCANRTSPGRSTTRAS